jgi:hypothetical protein
VANWAGIKININLYVVVLFFVSNVTAMPVPDGRQIQNNQMAETKRKNSVSKPRGIKR